MRKLIGKYTSTKDTFTKSVKSKSFRAEENDVDYDEDDNDTFNFAGKNRSAKKMASLMKDKWGHLPFYNDYIEHDVIGSNRVRCDTAKFSTSFYEIFMVIMDLELGLEVYFDGGDNSVECKLVVDEYVNRKLHINDSKRALCLLRIKNGASDEEIVDMLHSEVASSLKRGISEMSNNLMEYLA